MIRISTVQLSIIPGNIRANFEQIEREIQNARKQNTDILIFPELCLSGYMIGDLWEQNAFLRECERYGQKIADAAENIIVIFGNIAVDPKKKNNDGRVRKYNAAFAACNGQFLKNDRGLSYTIKTLLPDYRQFDDKRHFTSLPELAAEENQSVSSLLAPFTFTIRQETLRAGIVLCEDSWDENARLSPMEILSEKNIDIFFNLSASPFTLEKNDKRHRLFSASLSRLGCPMLYINRRGLENNGKDCYTYDGMTAAYDPKGTLLAEAVPYQEEHSCFSFDIAAKKLAAEKEMKPFRGDMLLPALRYGLKEFLSAIHAGRVVIGISGGIDSAVNAALYRSVLPAENLLLVNTPTRFNSETTKNLARRLAENLEAPFVELPIDSFINETVSQIDDLQIPSPSDMKTLHLTGFMKENIQARDRSTRILATLSSAFGGIFTCNANKTELTVGYGTLYGDLSGALAATADLWKHQIYALGRTLNRYFDKNMIPDEIFTVRPSAELSENQDITKGWGDPLIYEYHDFLFRSFIEPWNRITPEEILTWYSKNCLEEKLGTPVSIKSIFKTHHDFITDLEKWWNLFAGFAVAKRIQAPPLLAVSRRPYGYDLRESQIAPYYTDTYIHLKNSLLSNG